VTAVARLRALVMRYLGRSSVEPPGPGRSDRGFAIHTHGATLAFVTMRGRKIADSVKVAATFGARRRGLLDYRTLPANAGLLLSPGGSIHTAGMPYSIDVLFLDEHMQVLKCVSCLQPWRVALAPTGTSYVLELTAGRAAATGIQAGGRLFWSESLIADVHR
jgi:uncharacterized membrane protein (UPF0127 family)